MFAPAVSDPPNALVPIPEIGLTEIDGEPRARDLDLAERLGFDRPRDIRKLIERHRSEVEAFGICASVAQNHSGGHGRPGTEFWLTEEQSLLLAMLSEAPNAPAVRAMLIRVFVAWRRGHLMPMDGEANLPGDVLALLKRNDGISRMLAHKVTVIEKAVPSLVEAFERLSGHVADLTAGADPRVAVLEYVSVRGLLDNAGAVRKGRNRLNRKVGFELRDRVLTSEPPITARRCPHSGVWLFPRDFAAVYMAERGGSLVRQHNDAQRGQLHLLEGSKA